MKLGDWFMTVRRAYLCRISVKCDSVTGFTIVETMIVLAITGGLFIVIAASLAGRESAAEFTHAIQSVQSQIQQTINQVSAGFYPSTSNFTCAANGGGLLFQNGVSNQGSNQDCIFLGKVMQFSLQNVNSAQFQTYTVAGLRGPTIGSTSPFQNVTPTVVGVDGNYTNYATVSSLSYGLKVAWMKTGAKDIGAFGILMEPGSLSASNQNSYSSGVQQIDLVPLPGTSLGQSVDEGVAAITNALRDTNLTANAPVNPSEGVQICFASAGTNQSGLVTIGGSGRQLLVTLDVRSNKTCA
jgi:type II secretory pathway pseudopilin PulG